MDDERELPKEITEQRIKNFDQFFSVGGELDSNLNLVSALSEEYEHRLSLTRWPEDEILKIKLAFDELLVNAIIHGNKEDQTKKVKIKIAVSENMTEFSIEDEGSGFKPENIPDPTADDNLLKPSGRGLLIIEGDITRNEKGNKVTLKKLREQTKHE